MKFKLFEATSEIIKFGETAVKLAESINAWAAENNYKLLSAKSDVVNPTPETMTILITVTYEAN